MCEAEAVAVEFVLISTSWPDAAWRLFEVQTILLFLHLLIFWNGPPFDTLARSCFLFVSSLFSIFLKTVCNEISEKDNTGQHLHEAGSLLAYSTHQTIDIWYWV